jgi:chromosome segregation ATPase
MFETLRKSAILAAIQICLGAGAKRTHRARNLMELIRKEGDAHRAIVQVTLHNKGGDAFQPEIYGDAITIQRIISKSSGNAYKLLNSKGEDPKKSKNARKDLDMLLDQLNIQVENPVAVLDQEEAKKFLCGKPEDKYAFFVKATELERLDKTYAVIKDNIMDMSEACDRIKNDLGPLSEKVQEYEREYKQFEVLEKMEEKLSGLRCLYAWSFYAEAKQKADEEEEVSNLKSVLLDCVEMYF